MFNAQFGEYSRNAEAEAEVYLTAKLRNKIVSRMAKKAHLIHERGTIHVPAPYVQEETPGADFMYGALQGFDRRAFLEDLAQAHKERSKPGGATKKLKPPEAEQSTNDLVAMFSKVDVNGDGGVSREELVKNCHLLNLSVEEAHRLFDKLDVDGDGEVSADEFAKAIEAIENNAIMNLVLAICEGDAGRLDDGLHRHSRNASIVDPKRLNVKCRVHPSTGVGTFGTMELLNFPNQNGDLGRRLGGDFDRRIPRCSHVATDELEIAYLGKSGHGIAGGLFLIDGDTLLHAVMRNAHLPNRVAVAEVLLRCSINPNAVSSDGRRPYELGLEGRRHVWRRDVEDRAARRDGAAQSLARLTAQTAGV